MVLMVTRFDGIVRAQHVRLENIPFNGLVCYSLPLNNTWSTSRVCTTACLMIRCVGNNYTVLRSSMYVGKHRVISAFKELSQHVLLSVIFCILGFSDRVIQILPRPISSRPFWDTPIYRRIVDEILFYFSYFLVQYYRTMQKRKLQTFTWWIVHSSFWSQGLRLPRSLMVELK
jgi:hypothetical protein